MKLMNSENKTSTIHLVIRNESIELPSTLFRQLIQYSSSSNIFASMLENKNPIYLDVDPNIFNAYLLYLQSGCFIRPDHLSQEDLINGLCLCHAPFALIHHYKSYNPLSALHSVKKKIENSPQWSNLLILLGLFISTCILTIDLYRQILILNKNAYQAKSQIFVVIIYLIDGILFLYSCLHGIFIFLSNTDKEKQRKKNVNFLIDMISCLGILCYFTTQRPITNVYLTEWNFLWTFVHFCRTFRLLQIGYYLIDIQSCLYAIIQCFSTFLQTITGLFWVIIFSGSILYTIDLIEQNQQYSNMSSTILSAYETLYTIGYRNNAPYGYLTRVWTIINIYLFSSLIQLVLWWFQTRLIIE